MKSYLPGTWYAILGDRVTLVLPPAEKHRVAGLWDVVDAGAGFDEVLDRLLAGGLSNLAGFGLVGVRGETMRALFRGNARAVFTTVEGTYSVDGTGAATWTEGEVSGVSGFVIELDAEVLAPHELVIGTGLVRVARVTSPAAPVGGAVPVAAAVPPPAVPIIPVDSADPITPIDPLAPVSEATMDPIEVLAPGFGGGFGGDHDGHTSGAESFGSDSPTIALSTALSSPPAAVTTHPVARLLISTGESLEVDRAVLFGRAPEARRFQVGEEPRLVSVPSPHQEISATHLEIRPGAGADHGTAVVTDLGSTNGTVVVQPGLGPEELQAGIAVQLIPGAIVDLGDGVTIQVINP